MIYLGARKLYSFTPDGIMRWQYNVLISDRSVPAGETGWDTSLASINGNPAISYRHFTNGDLRYVRVTDASGTAWGAPLTLDSAGETGMHASLASINGNPAISYYDFTNGDLRYVRATDANGAAWGAPLTLDSAGFTGLYSSLAMINGNPAISYYDNTNDDLRFIRFEP